GGTRHGVIYCAGGGGTEASWQVSSNTNPDNMCRIVEDLAIGGHRIATFADNWDWGNSTNMTQMDNLWTYVKANYGFATDKVHLVGVSMGTAPMFNWAKANP